MDTIFQLESLDIFEKVSQELLTSLYYVEKSSNTILEGDAFEKAKEELRLIITECNFDIQKVNESICSKGWNQENMDCFLNLVKQNWSELLRAALNHYNSTHGETIINFDWIVKYVLGTSELKTLKYPLLQLVLSTVNKTGQQKRVMYDINKEILLKVINVLENI